MKEIIAIIILSTLILITISVVMLPVIMEREKVVLKESRKDRRKTKK